MPAIYAHYCFGQQCLATLPVELKEICEKHIDIYNFGVHGPDIFFYSYSFYNLSINKFGSKLHRVTGKEFFTNCKDALKTNSPYHDAMVAYTCGFLAHFTLDSHCHGYINELTEAGPLSHNMIESQYEAHLLRSQGNPTKVDRSFSLIPSKESAKAISQFFQYSDGEMYRVINGQKLFIHLLYSPSGIKKQILRAILKLAKNPGHIADLFLDKKEMPRCQTSNRKIDEMWQTASVDYPVIVKSFWDFVNHDTPLNELFDFDFEGINQNK